MDDDGEVIGGYPSQQPIGVKASKLKGGNVDQTSVLIYTLQEGNRQLLEQLKKINAQKQRFLDIQKKSYALAEFKEEKKNSIAGLEFYTRSQYSCVSAG